MVQNDPGPEAPSRYVVGIDLGTTNSALAYVDTHDASWRVRTFSTPQVVAAGVVEPRETLPSFHYEGTEEEACSRALALPWGRDQRRHCVGVYARDHGADVPGRAIFSAKSWLCHSGVDRTAAILPWQAAVDVERLSPVEVSARYLSHFREAWNSRFAEHPLESQDLVLTLPASFDEVARELTVRAARLAGLARVVLLEEPQAAFYAWIHRHGDSWEEQVHVGQKILVCDIGGGTTDFTLIRVRADAANKVVFHRVAVGEHLILGGDNLDLALAHYVESRLADGARLEPRQWSTLVHVCRQAKETLLGASPPERFVVHVPAVGSRLIGGARQVELTREEVEATLVDGFLPRVPLDARPQARRSGFQEFGLPYAADSSMTRYLAAFLTAHTYVGIDGARENSADHDPARPDIVLFNGGLFESERLKVRLVEVLSSWFSTSREIGWRPTVLENDRLDLAVARGAAYYGMVRRGQGVRISAGLARSYYLAIAAGEESDETKGRTAVCVAPAGVEEGKTVDLRDRRFELLIRQPVEFAIHVSSTRLLDAAGSLVKIDPEQMSALPPIRTVLDAAKKGAVQSVLVEPHSRLSEIGTLDLWLGEVGGPRSWRLVFDVRAATQTDREGHTGAAERAGFVEQSAVDACLAEIRGTFGEMGATAANVDDLVKRLEATAGMTRREWPPTLLRAMWESLLEGEAGRRRSATHEARWLYLVGFTLRPGYGLALDDWRVAQTWRSLQGKRHFHTPQCRAEWLILWRRIAGGLSAGQQKAIAEPFLAALRQAKQSAARGRSKKIDFGQTGHEISETWRVLGALEWLHATNKAEIGEAIAATLARESATAVLAAQIWALGRLGARRPMYGPLNTLVASAQAEAWAATLLDVDRQPDATGFALMQLAMRTGDRHRDVNEPTRRRILDWLSHNNAPRHYIQLVESGGELADDEQGLMFGESLPIGLRLASGVG